MPLSFEKTSSGVKFIFTNLWTKEVEYENDYDINALKIIIKELRQIQKQLSQKKDKSFTIKELIDYSNYRCYTQQEKKDDNENSNT